MMEHDNPIAQTLRMRRAELRQTQRAAATQVGIHPQTWSLWERGMIRPVFDRKAQLAEWLGPELAPRLEAAFAAA